MKTLFLMNIVVPTTNRTTYERVALNAYPICVVANENVCDIESRENVVSFLTSNDVDIMHDMREHALNDERMLSMMTLCVNAISTNDDDVFEKSTKYEFECNELLREIHIDI